MRVFDIPAEKKNHREARIGPDSSIDGAVVRVWPNHGEVDAMTVYVRRKRIETVLVPLWLVEAWRGGAPLGPLLDFLIERSPLLEWAMGQVKHEVV
jgi:hypothetical protein